MLACALISRSVVGYSDTRLVYDIMTPNGTSMKHDGSHRWDVTEG
jgi:hypothetical protein